MKNITQSEWAPCLFCKRQKPLTFHHLIPKKVHRRKYFKKNYTREDLNQGIEVCRLCHNGIHDLVDEMKLAKELNTIEALQTQPDLCKHFAWVAKQK